MQDCEGGRNKDTAVQKERACRGRPRPTDRNKIDMSIMAYRKGKSKGGEDTMGNNICPYCGAHLDPGEKCDCRDGGTEAPQNEKDLPGERRDRDTK